MHPKILLAKTHIYIVFVTDVPIDTPKQHFASTIVLALSFRQSRSMANLPVKGQIYQCANILTLVNVYVDLVVFTRIAGTS